jgi:hypothetical protein
MSELGTIYRIEDELNTTGTFDVNHRQIIAQVEVAGAAAATIDFQNIPSYYKNLRIIYSLRGDTALAVVPVYMRWNADASANYCYQRILGQNVTVTPSNAVGQTSMLIAAGTGATAGAGMWGCGDINIPVYSINQIHGCFALNMASYGTTAATQFINYYGGWLNVAMSINRITLTPSAGNFIIGSRVYLLGE